jgi:hypothetical protein
MRLLLTHGSQTICSFLSKRDDTSCTSCTSKLSHTSRGYIMCYFSKILVKGKKKQPSREMDSGRPERSIGLARKT